MPEHFAVIVDGRRRAVELRHAPAESGQWQVVVDGRVRVVDVRALGEGVWSVIEAGKARLIQVDGAGGSKLTVEVSHPDGEPRICVVEVADGHIGAPPEPPAGIGARSDISVPGPLTIRAPIPGRLVKLLVKVGDRVQSGQTVLVLEAMKMENELRAPRAGLVAAIHAVEGVPVDSGQELISIA